MENNRNTIIFFVLAIAVLFGYETLVMGPAERRKELEARQVALQQRLHPGPTAPGGAPLPTYLGRQQALSQSPRVPVNTPALTGSIALRGGRIDDLDLKGYRQTTNPKSPLVSLLRPEGGARAYFAQTGWTGAGATGLPDENTIWTAPAGASLSPGAPVVLTWQSPSGVRFTRTIAVDDKAMFTITDQAANGSAQAVALAPYGSVQRQCIQDTQTKSWCQEPDSIRSSVVHEGAIGWLGARLRLEKYNNWKKKDQAETFPSTGGWLGITDKYWMAAFVPDQNQQIQATFRVTPEATSSVFEANYVGPVQTAAPGAALTQTVRLYAGAKTVPLLKAYQQTLGVPEFDQAVDWGNFWFLTRPLFVVIEFFYQHVGNFGVAILLLTVCVRGLFFPLANKSYESMTRMRKVQPELEKIKKLYAQDQEKQQKEMMALYQREKINPLGGCAPMLLQIPVFFALYKVLSVTIEMRHAPFFGWVHDLSARDPTSIVNLFGLLPFDPATVPVIGLFLAGALHVGIWPLIYLVTMWLTMSMSPQTGVDPAQQKVMQFMPLIFAFTFSSLAVGIVIYYSWSNVLSLAQQYVIMKRFGVDNPIDGLIRKLTGKAKPA